MRALLIILAFIAGAGAGIIQRGPVELGGYRISLRGGAPTLTPIAQTPATPTTSREQWAYDLAVALGNAAPSAETVAFVVAWTRAEDGDDAGALARHNPLNTTEDTGAVMVVNSHGVKGYATREDGLDATVRTLGYGYAGYQDIREGIATNDPERALAGLYASPWGTHAGLVEQVWREILAAQPAPAIGGGGGPHGSPLGDVPVTMTQGYGVGTHAPAETWGGVDLIVAGGETLGAPIYATIDGEARQSTTWPCGNGVELVGDGWRLLHCHLSAFGAAGPVRAGDVIGYVGSSGSSTGPHLHYEVWREGRNVNPCDYLDVC